ncbi:hypothetical protein [Paenibacillus piri]|uniref:DUF4380 domain-containing protein n=1 Tax=Paenibacillus piri TaxID=2547395 RepID=A0A4R5KRJ3_9BACL|nr:hypothetical protein [Paenibacillus piri]TDF98012.1 hypothetical protein E1757_10870 [Paenibacillus piri]
MMPIYEEVDCLGFHGQLVRNDSIEITVVPEIGGRIMEFGPIGTNLLFVNEGLHGFKPKSDKRQAVSLAESRKSIGFLLYGGEKTWLAPQADWDGPPYAELDHGVYDCVMVPTSEGTEIQLISPICQETQLQIVRRIRIPHEGRRIRIRQEVVNRGNRVQHKGIWQVTMLRKPGIVHLQTAGTSRYEKGVHYFDSTQTELGLVEYDKELALVHCDGTTQFKVGTDINNGFVDTWLPGQSPESPPILFRKSFGMTRGPYGHGCAVEVFQSSAFPYFEVEVHAPLTELGPDESAHDEVVWELL